MRLEITYDQALETCPEQVKSISQPLKYFWFYDVHIEGECWELLTASDTETLERMTRKYLSENTKVRLICKQFGKDYEYLSEFPDLPNVPEELVRHYVKAFELLRECDGFEAMRAVWKGGTRAVIAAMRPYKNDPKFYKYNKHVDKSYETK